MIKIALKLTHICFLIFFIDLLFTYSLILFKREVFIFLFVGDEAANAKGVQLYPTMNETSDWTLNPLFLGMRFESATQNS